MKLLHILDEPYDSGIVHYGLTAARALADRGHAVSVAGRPDRYPVQEAARLGLPAVSLPPFPASVVFLRRLLQERSIELVNVHTGSSHTLAVLATRGLDPEPKVVRTRGDSRPVRRTAASSLLWQRTAGFIAATAAILTQFRGANPHWSFKMQAILPGIPDPSKSVYPDRQPSSPIDGLTVGMVARLDPVKGHAWFLQAAKDVLEKHPRTRFRFAGKPENVSIEQLTRTARELGIGKQVEFLGRVEDAAAFMAGCDIGAVASMGSEAISRVAIEWLATGKPVASTSVGSLPEILTEGETAYLLPPEEPELMSRHLIRLIEDAELRKSFGEAGRRRYEKLFTAERLAADTERFYEDVLQPVPSR